MTQFDIAGAAKALFDGINAHTAPGIGITRATYGTDESLAIAFVQEYAKSLGLEVTRDIACNLHVRLPGAFAAPEVVMGSHLDSVPSGGRFDGVAGVVAGLLVLERCARERTLLPRPIRLIALRGEESAWFGKCYLGSLALFGCLPKEALDLRDRSRGCDLRTAITACGGAPERIAAGERILDPASVACFYELHIEQGPVLEDAQEPLAVVTGIRGNRRYPSCVITGEPGHSGTTPQHLRKDAVLAAAEFLSKLESARDDFEQGGNDLVFTCGIAQTDATTHAMSVVPGTMSLGFEYRSCNDGVLSAFDGVCVAIAKEVSERRGVQIDLGPSMLTEPVWLNRSVEDALVVHASQVVGSVRRMPSGAGHDAAVFRTVGIPTGMLFVRNRHGSHNPHESMEMADFEKAVEVLYRAVIAA